MEETIKNGTYHYRKANYVMEGTEIDMCSEFVAQPLIKYEQPDRVIIIGTVKSAWAGFYAKFSKDDVDEKDDKIKRLFFIENKNGKDTTGKELEELQNTITELYKEGNLH